MATNSIPRNGGPGSGMPRAAFLSVTVPGAAWGWQEVLDKYGTMKFKQVLEPAATYAEQGLSAFRTHRLRLASAQGGERQSAASWRIAAPTLDPDSIAAWYIDGKQPKAGQIFRNPDLAKTFRMLQAQGPRRFLQGRYRQAPWSPRNRRWAAP